MSFTKETSGKLTFAYLKFRSHPCRDYLTYLRPFVDFCDFPLSHQLIPLLFKLAKSVFEHFSVYSGVSIQSGLFTTGTSLQSANGL